jgi:hypothetical protein
VKNLLKTPADAKKEVINKLEEMARNRSLRFSGFSTMSHLSVKGISEEQFLGISGRATR